MKSLFSKYFLLQCVLLLSGVFFQNAQANVAGIDAVFGDYFEQNNETEFVAQASATYLQSSHSGDHNNETEPEKSWFEMEEEDFRTSEESDFHFISILSYYLAFGIFLKSEQVRVPRLISFYPNYTCDRNILFQVFRI